MSGNLPQEEPGIFLTDSGLETDLIFNRGIDLPDFAAFTLLRGERGTAVLRQYFAEHLAVAARAGLGIVLETATWRANPDWGARLGYDAAALDAANRAAVEQLLDLRATTATGRPVVVSGCLGPRGDGYVSGARMSEAQAHAYHRPQVDTFAAAGVDLVSVLTVTYPAEAVGVVRAAREAGLPVVVSFTVETDGVLPDGTTIGAAIRAVDDATGGYPAYYMINCAHPSHVVKALDAAADWAPRLRGFRANASRRSHAELDEATELDSGDPERLGSEFADLRSRFGGLTVLGGCCGTDVRHIRQIAAACAG